MKTYIASLMMVVVVLASMMAMAAGVPTPTTASAPTVTMPIRIPTSLLELESFALGEVTHGVLYGGSAGAVLPGGTMVADVYATNPDIRVMLNELQQSVLSFDVGDPSAEQWVGENLLDQNGYQLFWGSNEFYPQENAGNWAPPDWAMHISLQMNSEIPIALGIDEAHAIVTDENGSNRWVDLYVSNGQAFYPVWLLGANGQLVFTPVGGGTPTIYNLNTGGQVPPTPVKDKGVQSAIANLIILDDPENIVLGGVGKAGGGMINPLYQVTLTSANDALSVQATAPNGEEAVAVTYRLVAGGEPVTAQIPGRGSLSLDAGVVYNIWFTFPTWGVDQPAIPDYPPCEGGCG